MVSGEYEYWTDRSPHEVGFVVVGDVRLHYLDWGGDGPPLVLLPGLGDTAHVFDEFAPLLNRYYRVLALTRRGHGASSLPDGGFDPQSLAGDIAGFLDGLELEEVTLVGHSIAGNEMTVLATARPERLSRLVYLDAAYDRTGTFERMQADPAFRLPKGQRPIDLDEYRDYGREHFGFWNDALEADLRSRISVGEDGALVGTAPQVTRSMLEASAQFKPDYRSVHVPAVAVYATLGNKHWSARVNKLFDQGEVRKFMQEVMQPWQRSSMEQFSSQIPAGEVVKLEAAHHHLFFSHRDWLVRSLTLTESQS